MAESGRGQIADYGMVLLSRLFDEGVRGHSIHMVEDNQLTHIGQQSVCIVCIAGPPGGDESPTVLNETNDGQLTRCWHIHGISCAIKVDDHVIVRGGGSTGVGGFQDSVDLHPGGL